MPCGENGAERPALAPVPDAFWGGLCRGDLGPRSSAATRWPRRSLDVRAAHPGTDLLRDCLRLRLRDPARNLAAVRRNTFIDYFNRIFSLLGLSVPAFYLGILLILVFSVKLRRLPGGGRRGLLGPGGQPAPPLSAGVDARHDDDRLRHAHDALVHPRDHSRGLRAHRPLQGAFGRMVLYKHVLRNALIPIVALGGLYAVVLIGSSVMVEIVFSRPGLGKLMVGAIKQRDYTTLQSVMVILRVPRGRAQSGDRPGRTGSIDPRIKYK